jgi:hypothetical protein
MTLMIKTRATLALQRDEFRIGIFRKLSDMKSVFLWQILFYLLKRIQIFILIPIFIFGMQELNVFYIGLLFFLISYTSSLATYRRSGYIMVAYSGFFIWLAYFYSLIASKLKYDDANGDSKDNLFGKIFSMLTFTKFEEDKTGINGFMQYSIPGAQWIIFMLSVLMATTNSFFREEAEPLYRKSPQNETKMVCYASEADYYEAKCDYVLRKKFPGTIKLIVRLASISSEMMILIILIIQGVVLASQAPNLIFWGFLIFSFTLQTAVVSTIDINIEHLQKCVTHSKILRIYSSIAMSLQIIYYFIYHPSFLAKYGIDVYVNEYLGEINDYMSILGFFNQKKNESELRFVFLSQVMF